MWSFGTAKLARRLKRVGFKTCYDRQVILRTGIWINSSDQSLSMLCSFIESPDPPFLFSRIRFISSNTSKEYSIALYHQISDKVLVEDKYMAISKLHLGQKQYYNTKHLNCDVLHTLQDLVTDVLVFNFGLKSIIISMLDRWLFKSVRIG